MEVSTIVSLAIYAVTILTVLIGFLFGLWKGLKKASLRLGVFLVFLVISALISQPITKAILKINVTIGGNTASITDQIVNLLCSIEVIDGFYQSSSAFAQLINVIPVALINCIVFILLTLILSLIGYFVYLILAAIFIKRNKKPYAVKNGNTVVVADYKSEKKYRLLGGLIGGVQSFIFIFVLFMPITAIFSTFADLSQSTTTKVAYASTQTNNDLTPTSKLLRENLPPIVFEISDAYNRTLFSKISNIGNFDQICFDSLTTVKVDGQKITLRKELNNIAVVYDNVSSLTNINFESTKLSQLDYNKIEMALDALFESGILKSILPDVLDYVLTNIDSAEGIMGFTIPAEYVPYVQALQIEFKNNKSMDMIKTDIFAFFGIFKTLGESGVLDELQKDEITLENILTAVNKDERIVVTNVVSNLLNSNFAKAILIEVLNQGLMTLDSLDENVQIPQIDKSQVNWTQVKSELNSVLNAMLDIYDNLKANVGIGTLEELKLKPTRILNVDTDKLTTSLSTIFEQLQNSHLLVSNSEEKIYNKLIDLFENSEYSKYVDLTVFKQQDSWQTELGYLNTSLKNIKNSGVIPVIIDSNVDYELAVDKIAAKDPEDNKTFVRKIVSPLLESKAFARMLNVGFGFLDQLISTYQSQLGENVELGKIQAETFSEDAEKELVVTFFENMVVYAEELNLTELKSDAFSAIITSNLARLGDALDSIKASKLFGEYIEEDLSENEGIYVNLINALANNPDFNRFADFEVAKDASFSWNAELSLLQDAIDTLNNIKINIDGTEKNIFNCNKRW